MVALALHTSSPELGLALQAAPLEQPRCQTWPLGRELSSHLHDYLQTFIQPHGWSELTWLAVAIGPGGFTGTRVGVTVARTLAQQLSIPLFGISSLGAAAAAQGPAPAIAVSMAAQRGEIFGGIYGWQGQTFLTHVADQVYSANHWQQTLGDWPQAQRLELSGGLAHTVEQVLTLAHHQWQGGRRPGWEAVFPFYGQHPVR